MSEKSWRLTRLDAVGDADPTWHLIRDDDLSVQVFGEREGLEEVLAVLQRGESARAASAKRFSGDGYSYFVVFCAESGQIGSTPMKLGTPIEHYGHVQAIANAIAERLKQRITIISWQELDPAPVVTPVAMTGPRRTM